jgi:peptide/nickel transport system permease protein
VLRSKTFVAGALLLVFWIFCALFGEMIAPKNPFASDPLASLQAPSGENWFGTDRLGRDVFSRVLAGARDILIVAPLATLLGTVLGTAIGLATGYFRGLVDDVLMRIVDAVLAIPLVIMGLLVLVALSPSRVTVIVTIGIVFAPLIARTVRAAVLSEAQLEYVQAAKLRNERAPYILFAEILPNVFGPVMVEFTVRLGYAIFVIATLSFLGLGIQPPAPDWGLQIYEHYGVISAGFWWPVLFPSLAIATLIVGVNLLSDGLTQALSR